MACEACCVEGMLSVLREPSLVLIESLRTSQKSDSSAKIILASILPALANTRSTDAHFLSFSRWLCALNSPVE